MPKLYFDTETFSECDLRTHSTQRYFEHPSTEIIMAQWAVDDGEPVVVDTSDSPRTCPPALRKLLLDPGVTAIAHKSDFDRTAVRLIWGIDVPVERWQDTMVKALAHGLPGGLDKLGVALGLPEDKAKDKRGRDLIQLFCKPRPKNMKLRRATRETHPKEWAEFCVYGGQDVIAMREVDSRLPSWNYRSDGFEIGLWHLDQRINDRGFCVDLELARSAIDAVAKEQVRLKSKLSDSTNGLLTSPSKRDQLLAYILLEHGVDLPDMRADTLKRRMEDPELPDAVKLLLSLRLEATKTSTAKYKALINTVSADGRLRNTMQFCGASRTGRWAGRVFQPQNLPRPDMDNADIDIGIDALKADCVEIINANVMRLTSNAVRGCIIAPSGKKLCVADLSNIEGRGLAFLAGEHWKLRAFKDYDTFKLDANGECISDGKGGWKRVGEDLYILAYARAFGISPEAVSKYMRQIGKVMELGLGYEGGVGAFLTFAAVYGLDLDELAAAVWANAPAEWIEQANFMWDWFKQHKRSTLGLPKNIWVACECLVLMWRDAHPSTKALWDAAGDAVRLAIARKGEVFSAGEHIKIRCDGAWLRCRLPSGRYLCYLQPRVDVDGQISYMGVNQYTRQWARIKTYGGKFVENWTQGFARDVMAHNMPAIENADYEIVLSVHDEMLTETPDTDDYSHERLAEMLATNPPWAKGLPLAAAGFECHRYRKD